MSICLPPLNRRRPRCFLFELQTTHTHARQKVTELKVDESPHRNLLQYQQQSAQTNGKFPALRSLNINAEENIIIKE